MWDIWSWLTSLYELNTSIQTKMFVNDDISGDLGCDLGDNSYSRVPINRPCKPMQTPLTRLAK